MGTRFIPAYNILDVLSIVLVDTYLIRKPAATSSELWASPIKIALSFTLRVDPSIAVRSPSTVSD
jgi:hypothetical protein